MKKVLLISILITTYNLVFSQKNEKSNQEQYSGISIHYSAGKIGIKDYYISNQKYSGITNGYNLEWNKNDSNYHKRIEIQYNFSKRLENNNITGKIDLFSINNSYLYPIGSIDIINKELNFYVGPSTNTKIHFRQLNIANGETNSTANSFLAVLSGNFNSDLSLSLTNKITFYFQNNFNLITIGSKSYDSGKEDEKPLKILTPFAGLLFDTKLFMNFQLVKRFSLNLGYYSKFSNINAWDKYVSINDNFLFLR